MKRWGMVEKLSELNRICQKPRYREVGNWMVRHLLRDAALPVTWLLLHTPVTANQVTLASLFVGLAGISLFAFPSSGMFLSGVLLLQLWYYLDHVDGQIARYRKTACLSGRFFDFLTHHLIHGVIPFSLGVCVFEKTGEFIFVIWGFAGSVTLMIFNLINDTKYKTFFEAMKEKSSVSFLPRKEKSKPPLEQPGEGTGRRIFSILHKMVEIHVMMNLLTLAALVQYGFGWHLDFRFLFLVFYGIILPLITGVKCCYLIGQRKIDQEYHDSFQTEG